MNLDAFNTAYSLKMWRGLPVKRFQVPIAKLRENLPEFELRPFGLPPHDNPRMRCIVRSCTDTDSYERPIAAVSDQYELLQHQVLATWLYKNLAEAGREKSLASVTMTEYGERLRVVVPLNDKNVDMAGNMFKPDPFRPELEITNSVDRSLAFTVVLRWRRLICLNGMYTKKQDRLRSIHRVDLSRTHTVHEFITDQLSSIPDVMSDLKLWRLTPVSMQSVQVWCEGWLRHKSGWTVENCARLWAILETGYDGTVVRPPATSKKLSLSSYRVGQHRRVLGVAFPVTTAFDVAQLLTWITSNQRTVEMQIEGTEDVPRLMSSMLKVAQKSGCESNVAAST